MNNPAELTSRLFFGWKVVGAAFVLAIFGWGVGFYGPPIFLHTVIGRTGWSVGFVSSAVTIHFLSGAVLIANLPRLYRKIGVPAVTAAGAAILAVGVYGWAVASEPWQLILAAVTSGIGWVTMGAAAVNAIVAPWFVHRRPAALATAYNGASIGGVIFSPLWVALIAAFGFASSAILVGVVMTVAVSALAVSAFSKTPELLGQTPDGTAEPARTAGLPPARPLAGADRPLWRERRFMTLAGGMALGLFAQIGLLAHLFSLLVPAMGERSAGFALGLATAAAIAGRTLVGWAMPVGADRRRIAAASHAVQVAGVVALIVSDGQDIPLILLGVVLFGAGIGNATSLPPLIAQAEFAAEDVARVVPLVVSTAQATYAFAPAAFGLLRNAADPTSPVSAGMTLLIAAALVQVAAIACLLAGQRRG